MGKNQLKNHLIPACVALSGFFLPIWIQGTTLFILIGILLFPFLYKQLRNPFRSEIRWFTCISIALFLWQLSGMFYTENTENGWFNLQQKIPILLFGLYAGFLPAFNSKWKKRIKIGFISGCILCGLSLLFNAIELYRMGNDPIVFSYVHFSPDIHPSYLALYFCVALVFGFDLLGKEKSHALQLFFSFSLLIIYGFIVLLQSKSGVIGAIIVIAYALVIFVKQRNWFFIAGCISALVLINWGFIELEHGRIPSRINQAVSALQENPLGENQVQFPNPSIDSLPQKKFKDSSQLRIEVWKSSIDVIREHWIWGLGAGDVREALVNQYNQNGLHIAAEKHLNAHNQFLQQWLAGGVVSLWLICVWLFSSAYKKPVFYNTSILIIPCLIAFNLLTESMLESQWGIIAIAFFLSINQALNSSDELDLKSKRIA